ncbi:cytochrome bd-I ubiquinol oxidase subunit 2 apoprotein [Tepidamorphus gemmatus]|uniref:Cytochrome bd-I ubiquinol oxidase subunit 2 apoprotein n=1 Tax=Tepidamorphus gemmatus TaxID=747076 RepID=A0A4R3M4U9_9HYPH|nr:cytochrome d ubiquinol oxidase subunit II [Tepidamorphus gemmatus]TCT08374.1 cytochrome bd-I ubiquinol oxidase subunit 2 apoprotein [Tepidamorphus gemmatus]
MDLTLDYYLPVIWAVIIASAVGLYVILDGFDLGIGILFPFARKEEDRDLMMNSVAPFWDGNETWLILGGGGLWVAFPLAYSIVMPALYLPVIVMLLALIFRGVSFEFRWVAKPKHRHWDIAFAAGSTVAAFCQGLILGGLIQGIEVQDRQYVGGSWDFLTPFSVLCGVGLVAGYALLGATWLRGRVEGPVADRAAHLAKRAMLAVLAFIAAVSIWTPLAFEPIADRWFSTPNIYFLWPVPVLTALLGLGLWVGLHRPAGYSPFFFSIGLFLLSYLGLAISTFPLLVPPSVTIWEAAAVPASQIFSLIGVTFMLPIVLGYTVFVYWTFRGKVRPGEGYH